VNINLFKTSKLTGALIAVAAVGIATAVLLPFRGYLNSTEVALAFVLIVLFASSLFGSRAGLAASIAGILVFNFFFLPPFYTFNIAGLENWAAFVAFIITALISGQLSGYARRRAEEAEHLYGELQSAFKTATEAEAFKQSEKLKSALLDAVTHDLRTPLTSIKASVTTLLESEGGHRTIELDSGGRAEFLSIINEETDRLNHFIEGMVELARLEAGSPTSGDTLANLDDILSSALDRATSLPGGHVVKVDLEPEPPLLRADARAVAEVIYNLLDNAAKYSPAGSTITVSARVQDERAIISVNDAGPGIPGEMRERVFEKFTRLDESKPGGMGLGLSIARAIIEAQGGTIAIADGDNGVGTKVILTLPIGD
jgi:two-component system sensor histidine kinase KdpD